ncbi:uncharacterized protein LOC121287775 [Carcharodon carcharias]|uniref:uncharacterized protein LOC121287775 n=1 Tax=Carcharodon carcharias TaxID=13397 RepID=UPI001B7F0EC2|nr:uncharacterized protein LOC121287775 [Carcharodon carcharias]
MLGQWLELSLRQQILDVQQRVREGLTEIHEGMRAMVYVVEKSLWSVSNGITLMAKRSASSVERLATLMDRQLHELNQGFLGMHSDLQSLIQAMTSCGQCQCGRWMRHPVTQFGGCPTLLSRDVHSDLTLVHDLPVISAGSSQGTSDDGSKHHTPLPMIVASYEAAATGGMPTVALATPSQSGPAQAPLARGRPPRSTRPTRQQVQHAVSKADASEGGAPRHSTRNHKLKVL